MGDGHALDCEGPGCHFRIHQRYVRNARTFHPDGRTFLATLIAEASEPTLSGGSSPRFHCCCMLRVVDRKPALPMRCTCCRYRATLLLGNWHSVNCRIFEKRSKIIFKIKDLPARYFDAENDDERRQEQQGKRGLQKFQDSSVNPCGPQPGDVRAGIAHAPFPLRGKLGTSYHGVPWLFCRAAWRWLSAIPEFSQMRFRNVMSARLSSFGRRVPNKCPRSVTESGQLLTASRSVTAFLKSSAAWSKVAPCGDALRASFSSANATSSFSACAV